MLVVKAKVADVAKASGWQFRRCFDHQLQQIIASIGNVQAPIAGNVEDVTLWRAGPDVYSNKLSSSKTWEQIQVHQGKKGWSKVVWFAQGVPRFAVRDRLATGARMLQWGVLQSCVFCGEPIESRDHLFFTCPYTFTVWLAVVGDLLEADADPDWDETLTRLVEHIYEKLTFILPRLVFQTTIYYIWRERNDRRHTEKLKSVTQLSSLIEKTVKNKIMSTRYFENHVRAASKMAARTLGSWQ